MEQQNFANHRRLVPMFHGFLFLLMLVAAGGSLYNVYRAWGRGSGRGEAILIAVLVAIVFIEGFYLRIFALKAQDRAIRVEENLRHYVMHGSLLDPKLDTRQIIGLRFASDEEFGELAAKAAAEGMSETDIKKAVKNWRGDYYRV